jgi:protein associated with RNAse G/E
MRVLHIPQPPRIPVRKTKFNGDLWGTFVVFLLTQTPERIVAWEPRGTYIRRSAGWAMRYDHLQFFFPQRWYVISADYGMNGMLRHCYCDIVLPWQPPTPEHWEIHYIDLELDLRAHPSGIYTIYDEDEFDEAIVTMDYPDTVRDGALNALRELIEAASAWQSPFAEIPQRLPRLDLHYLRTDSPEWPLTLQAMGLTP